MTSDYAKTIGYSGDIKTATICGAGVMGRQMAGTLLNGGVEKVYLIDIVPKPQIKPELLAAAKAKFDLVGKEVIDPEIWSPGEIRPDTLDAIGLKLTEFMDVVEQAEKEDEVAQKDGKAILDEALQSLVAIQADLDAQQKAIDANPSVLAKNVVAELTKAQVNPGRDLQNGVLMHASLAKKIVPGNYNDDLETSVKDSDLIIEAGPEKLSIKKGLYNKIEQFRKPDSIIASITSTIPRETLTEDLNQDMKQHFMIHHPFNPVRHMAPMELVHDENAPEDAVKKVIELYEVGCGKTVIPCKDTPGFKGNRDGMPYLLAGILHAIKQDIRPEEADAVMGKPVGFQKSGIFGTLDFVGLDVVTYVMESLKERLPENDYINQLYKEAEDIGLIGLLEQMKAEGYNGRKGKGGFYRVKKDDDGKSVKVKGKTVLQTLDIRASIDSGALVYRDPPASLASVEKSVAAGKQGLKAVVTAGDAGADYAWSVLRDGTLYTLGNAAAISDDIPSIDDAVREGYKWKHGPFQMLDKFGSEWFAERLEQNGIDVPPLLENARGEKFYVAKGTTKLAKAVNGSDYKTTPHKEGELSLAEIKEESEPVIKGTSASVWDVGDGVLCLEFHAKLNMMDPDTLLVMNEATQLINDNKDKYKGLVIYNEGPMFSAGAHLGLVGVLLKARQFKLMENIVYYGQSVMHNLLHSDFPVVGAPSGMALGGGCETLLACNAIQSHAELYTALVETGVGLIPGWNGNARRMERLMAAPDIKNGPIPPLTRAFNDIMLPMDFQMNPLAMSTSALDAQKKHWLRPQDGITMNRSRLLQDAKNRVLSMVDEGFEPPTPRKYNLAGGSGKTLLDMGIKQMIEQGMPLTEHEVRLAHAEAHVLTGGAIADLKGYLDASDMAQVEREAFVALLHTKDTQTRILKRAFQQKAHREPEIAKAEDLDRLRSEFKIASLPRRELPDGPLTGSDLLGLKALSYVTKGLKKLVPGF